MEAWKEFDANEVTHSAAHHLVAIAELIEKHGYARVSDVAEHLDITRGSVSVTLKGLRQKGLVTEDDRRHLGLSAEGLQIAKGVMAKKQVMKQLFIKVLGVEATQADIDTCKIEHLVSPESALHAARLLRFVGEESAPVREFFQSLTRSKPTCGGNPAQCPICEDRCLEDYLRKPPPAAGKKKGL